MKNSDLQVECMNFICVPLVVLGHISEGANGFLNCSII